MKVWLFPNDARAREFKWGVSGLSFAGLIQMSETFYIERWPSSSDFAETEMKASRSRR